MMTDQDLEDFERIEWPRDEKIDEARAELEEFFDGHRSEVFYVRQLQVMFEKRFFHWITGKALSEMQGGLLRDQRETISGNVYARFYYHRSNRYYKRQIKQKMALIRRYSDHTAAYAAGRQAEVLFLTALATRGFVCRGEETREFGGKKWEETEHDLDYVLERDGRTYGCEVKNTYAYIQREELEVKLRMCEYLALKPLFIMRAAPKNYINQIYGAGGYALIFVAQVHPFGSEALVKDMREVLGLPVDCPRAIPAGIIDRFIRWHERGL
jgi:hypothetical protein